MRISTIVLNWNRQALLEQTLRSYAATVVGPCELMVIDNASSDGSREVIERCRAELQGLEAIFFDGMPEGRRSTSPWSVSLAI